MEPISMLFGIGSKLIDKLFTTPEEKAKAQVELSTLIQQGELKELELLVKDRDSARKREMQVGGYANPMIGGFILSGFFLTIAALFYIPIGEGMKEPLFMLLGSLGTMATQVVAYYFGSSSGSARKDAMKRL